MDMLWLFSVFEALIDLCKSSVEKLDQSAERNGALGESSPNIGEVEHLHHEEALVYECEGKPFLSGDLGVVFA